MEIKEKVRNSSVKTKRDPVIRQKAAATFRTVNKSARMVKRTVSGTSATLQKVKQTAGNAEKQNEQDRATSTPNEFAIEQLKQVKNKAAEKGKDAAVSMTKWSAKTVRKETAHAVNRIKSNAASRAVKNAKQPIKTVQNSSRTFRRGKSVLKTGRKYPVRRYKKTVKTGKKAVSTTKSAVKSLAAVLKTIALAVKSMLVFLLAGGWLILIIILFAGLIAALIGSVFSIFFGNGYDDAAQNLTYGINEINAEFYENIKDLANGESYEQMVITIDGSTGTDMNTVWKQVLTVYAVRMTTGENADTAIDLSDPNRKEMLRTTFFDMVSMTGEISTSTEEIPDEENGTSTVERNVLNVSVTTKSAEEMKAVYGMDTEQRALIDELLAPSMDDAWRELLYGGGSFSGGVGNGDIVETAISQLGNVGGQPYWSWYGFSSRVEWCACFVSWCAEQNGFIEAGIIPKFANCDIGIKWFQERDQWRSRGYNPQPGDIIFFDWNYDGVSDHVGIVEYIGNGVVHTVEGNSGDACRRMTYALNSNVIQGYGTPAYTMNE